MRFDGRRRQSKRLGKFLVGMSRGQEPENLFVAMRSRPSSRSIAKSRREPSDLAPGFQAFRLPSGAPAEGPPCMWQRPLGIARDWHRFPLCVRAHAVRKLGSFIRTLGIER